MLDAREDFREEIEDFTEAKENLKNPIFLE